MLTDWTSNMQSYFFFKLSDPQEFYSLIRNWSHPCWLEDFLLCWSFSYFLGILAETKKGLFSMPPFPSLWWGTTPHTLNTKGLDSMVGHKTWSWYWALLPVPLPGQTEARYFSLCYQISHLLNGWMYSSQKKNNNNSLEWFLSIHRRSNGLRDGLGHAPRTAKEFNARLGPGSSLTCVPPPHSGTAEGSTVRAISHLPTHKWSLQPQPSHWPQLMASAHMSGPS